MIFQSKVKVAIVLWLTSEVIIASLVVKLLGWPLSLLVTVAAMALGFYLISRAGRAAFRAMDQSFREPSRLRPEALSSGVARALSGILLLVPGFASDVVGLALLSRRIRNGLLQRFGVVRGQARGRDIDLSPDEWRSE